MTEFLTVEQIAKMLRLSPDFVYANLSPNGTLRSYRFGSSRRVKRVDLDEWLAKHEERGESADVVQLRGA